MAIRQLIKACLPPLFLQAARKIFQSEQVLTWKKYDNWAEACAASGTYAANEIFEKVRMACAKVRDGEAVYERDSVLFDEIQYEWPLTAALMWAAARHGCLHLIDFGGAFGSTYFGNKRFLHTINDVSWNIVEQKHFVECVENEFSSDKLHFFDSIVSCHIATQIDGILFSRVLQYLDDPYMILKKVIDIKFDYIILDRTTKSSSDFDGATVQTVSSSIYNAVYPCWMFSQAKVLDILRQQYDIIEIFDSAADGNKTWGCLAVHKQSDSANLK